MLFEHWRQIAHACASQIALRDLTRGGQWTFGQLAAAVEPASRTQAPMAFPQSDSAEFIFNVLRAWRSGQIVCPLEPGQVAPIIGGELPPGAVHIKSTSATTGAPRLVVFTAAQLMADAENIVSTMGLRPDWPNLGVISLAHSYGFSNLVLPLLLHGIPLLLVGAALPEALRRAATLEEAVTLPAVPALWRAWHEAGAIPGHVRLAISAGAPLPVALERSIFEAGGLKIHNFYGSSECGGIAYDATAEPRLEGACAGAPLRNVRVSVGDDGCLQVSGPAVAETYWPEPSPKLRASLFHTSDLAEICDGVIYLRGRASDQINVAGRKVSPEKIEEVLATHPQVRECLAFGVPSADAERGETIVACVALKAEVKGETLKQFAMTKLPDWQVPREWWLVESLEANRRGKFLRAEWRRRYLEKAGSRR